MDTNIHKHTQTHTLKHENVQFANPFRSQPAAFIPFCWSQAFGRASGLWRRTLSFSSPAESSRGAWRSREELCSGPVSVQTGPGEQGQDERSSQDQAFLRIPSGSPVRTSHSDGEMIAECFMIKC